MCRTFPVVSDSVDQHDPIDPYGFNRLDLGWLRAKRGAKWSEPDVLPAWIADMDFPLAPPVRAAIEAMVDRGDLGYPAWFEDGCPLAGAFAERMAERYGWRVDLAAVRGFGDLLQILQVVLHLTTEPGDGVALHVPQYPPFLATLRRMRRTAVPCPLEPVDGGWTFDLARLADQLAATRCRTLLLVNPHNPTGRMFTRAELTGLAELVVERDLLVIADEVHADLGYPPHQHIPFATVDPEVAARTVTMTSATKAFNIAGIRCAVAHVGPPALRDTLDVLPEDLFGPLNVLGVAATTAAWRDGGDWLASVRAHLRANRDLLAELLVRRLPGVRFRPPQATYLAWLDCRELGLPVEPATFFRDRARVQLSPGPTFGLGGDGFVRLNFATSAPILTEIVDRMAEAVDALG